MKYRTNLEIAPTRYTEIINEKETKKEKMLQAAMDALCLELGLANPEIVKAIHENFSKAYEVFHDNPETPILGLKAIDYAADKAMKAFLLIGNSKTENFENPRPIKRATKKRKREQDENISSAKKVKNDASCAIQ